MLDQFQQIVAVDFEHEFGGHSSFDEANRSGERPRPVCGGFKELRSDKVAKLFRGKFGSEPPFPTGPETLWVSFYSSAEWINFLALGWPLPACVLDLYVEFRNLTNGLELPAGAGLVGALMYFGLDHISAQEKDDMRLLILRGGPWSVHEQEAILKYCVESDVLPLGPLLAKMAPRIDLPRALLRGRYMKAAARMEWAGTPIDTEKLPLLRRHWPDIPDELIAEIDVDYGVFDGRTFKAERWKNYLIKHGIPWRLHDTGNLDLSDDTFRDMAKAYPQVSPMRELRSALSNGSMFSRTNSRSFAPRSAAPRPTDTTAPCRSGNRNDL
jgi:hypothetical protein